MPVLLEVKNITDGTKHVLHAAVTQKKTKGSKVVAYSPTANQDDQSYPLPASTFRVTELFANVKNEDGRMLKRVPMRF